VIDPASIASLGLTATGSVTISTPSTGQDGHDCNQFDVSLIFQLAGGYSYTVYAVPVIEADLSVQGIQGLLGRDVLARCVFVYDGGAESISLSF